MPDAETVDVIAKLHEVDPVFREVCDLLFDGAVDTREAWDASPVSKMGDASEVYVPGGLKLAKKCGRCKGKCRCEVGKRSREEQEKLQARVGLASNVVGLGAGAAALGSAIKDPTLRTRVGAKVRTTKLVSRRTKALAAGALGLQALNLGGDLVANRVLNREARLKDEHVRKSLDEGLAEIVAARRRGTISTETAIDLAADLVERVEKAVPAQPQLVLRQLASDFEANGNSRELGDPSAATWHAAADKVREAESMAKGATWNVAEDDLVDYGFTGEIAKFDTDQRLAFGFCSLSTVDGKEVVDLQNDYAPIEEIEKSAYAYVIDSRVGGDMHSRDGERPLHTADLVESFVVTEDKLTQMGVPAQVAKSLPTGWWVGFKVNDDEQWAKVRRGERAGFSIHGKGSRVSKVLETA